MDDMTLTEREARAAEKAWNLFIENEGRRVGRRRAGRQHRRGDFLRGVRIGISMERIRHREVVTPLNLRLHDLVRALEEDPTLIRRLNAEIPETIKKVRAHLEGNR